MLTEYGNLQAANDILRSNKIDLENKSKGLFEKVKEKNQLSEEINKLAAQKSTLAAAVKDLEGKAKIKDQLEYEIKSLENAKQATEIDIKSLQNQRLALEEEVVATKVKLTELQPLKTEYEKLTGKKVELDKAFAEKSQQFELFQAFLGFLQNTTTEAMDKFVALAPEMVQWAKKGKYSPDAIKRAILSDLTMGQMSIYACTICGTRFFVASAPTWKGNFSCPNCNSRADIEAKTDTYAVISQMAGKTDQAQAILTPKIKPVMKP